MHLTLAGRGRAPNWARETRVNYDCVRRELGTKCAQSQKSLARVRFALASFPGSGTGGGGGGGGARREPGIHCFSGGIPPAPVRVRLPYRIRSCTSLIMNYSYKLALRPLLLRHSTKRFRTPLGISSVPIYALGPLTEQRGQRSVPFCNVALHKLLYGVGAVVGVV